MSGPETREGTVPFAPHEIENKRFVVALRGYQTDEVDAFLRAVAADYRAVLERAEASERTPAPTEEEVAAILRAAEREAEEIRAAANAQAEAVYEEVARRTAELQRLEAGIQDRLLALDRAVREVKHALGRGVSSLVP
jgi:DivIVA domain-containing protein